MIIIIYYRYGYFFVQVHKLFLHKNETVSYFFNHCFKSIMNLEQIYNDFIYMLGIAGTLKHSSYTLSKIKLKWTDSNSLLYKKNNLYYYII